MVNSRLGTIEEKIKKNQADFQSLRDTTHTRLARLEAM
jgi:hypothetical protein